MRSYHFSRYFKQWKMPHFLCKKIQTDNVLKEKCKTVYKQQLVLAESPSHGFLLPDSCLVLTQTWSMAVEFCHSQIKNCWTGTVLPLLWLCCLAEPKSMLIAKTESAGLGLMFSVKELPLCVDIEAWVSTFWRIFVQCRHVLVMILF